MQKRANCCCITIIVHCNFHIVKNFQQGSAGTKLYKNRYQCSTEYFAKIAKKEFFIFMTF